MRLSGAWTFHVDYHQNKEGVEDHIHCSTKHCDLWDSEWTSYNIIDTGNDKLSNQFLGLWGLWNNINGMNEG